jgi:ferredoxin-type protein NapH
MNVKKLTPIPAKRREEMPNSKLGITFKEWKAKKPNKHKWRNIRWGVLIFMNFLFWLSFMFDIGILEGSLSGSRFFGIYLMDPFNALQEMFIGNRTGYFAMLTTNFFIGLFVIITFYFLMGGRTFCSWLCPYHFLAENTEKLHNYLVKKKKVKSHSYHIGIKYIFWVGFLLIAFLTKNLVFENLNPVGIISRAIVYGPGLILLWIVGLLLFEIVYSKRFWCRYVCPIGVTYSGIGKFSPMAVKFDLSKCGHCRDCQDVCLVPHELWFVKRGEATKEVHFTGADCTRCGLCVDVCYGDALKFTVKGFDKLL